MSTNIIPSEIIPVMKVTLCEAPQSIKMITIMTGLSPFQIMEQLKFGDHDTDDSIYVTKLLDKIIESPDFSDHQCAFILQWYPHAMVNTIIGILNSGQISDNIRRILPHLGSNSQVIAKYILQYIPTNEKKLELLSILFGV